MQYKRKFPGSSGKPVLAALLIGLVLLLDAMVASPALHELIHKDANAADHQCAVTMFAHGKVDSAICEVPIAAPTVSFEATPSTNFFVFSALIEGLPHGRAPPPVCVAS